MGKLNYAQDHGHFQTAKNFIERLLEQCNQWEEDVLEIGMTFDLGLLEDIADTLDAECHAIEKLSAAWEAFDDAVRAELYHRYVMQSDGSIKIRYVIPIRRNNHIDVEKDITNIVENAALTIARRFGCINPRLREFPHTVPKENIQALMEYIESTRRTR